MTQCATESHQPLCDSCELREVAHNFLVGFDKLVVNHVLIFVHDCDPSHIAIATTSKE